MQVAGIVVAVAGAALALWCVLILAFLGKGTPVPFDPPSRLVVRGPYRAVRNPMAIGVGLALFGFTGLFVLGIHLLVVGYEVGCEEPTLRSELGSEYEAYTRQVGRWWPRRSR